MLLCPKSRILDLRLPTHLVQLLIGLQREREIVRSIAGHGLAGVYHLPDDIEVIFLRFFIDGAVASKGAD